uniref:N-6 DNA methylase n=1 Tax=Larkinella sp. C7 TaxID=2576607 RepID=UPI00148729BE
GRLGIVLPESLITSKSYSHVIQHMRERGQFHAVIGMPEDFFKTSGKGGTHTKACLIVYSKGKNKKKTGKSLFMAEAKWCGHDSRGRKIEHDDLPKILENYFAFEQGRDFTQGRLGYIISTNDLQDNILSPRYYNPDVKNALLSVKDTHDIIKFGDLVESGVIEVKTGNEVGKLAYGTGDIPFVRTSDISNWEIKLDPKHGVSEDIFKQFTNKQDVRENDLLMVKDGTYLIGTCAIVSKYDTRIVYQSHLYKIRVLKPNIITPFLLLAILSSEPLQQQIKAKRFTQDIIDSLGARIYELILPVPKDKKLKKRIEDSVKRVIEDRVEARELARLACTEVAGGLAIAELID